MHFNRQEFEDFYKSHTKIETAKHLQISLSSVARTVTKYNCFKVKVDLPKKFSTQQIELINGTMLGDGCLSKINKKNKSNLIINHGEKQLDYLEWKNEIMKPFSRQLIKTINNSEFPNNKKRSKPSICYTSYTLLNDLFVELEKKWYLRDKNDNYIFDKKGWRIKIVPNDLKLTPFSLAIWFFDDGRNNAIRRSASISTDSFTKNECNKLTYMLKENFNIRSKLTKTKENNFEIHILSTSYLNFIEIISPYAIDNILFLVFL